MSNNVGMRIGQSLDIVTSGSITDMDKLKQLYQDPRHDILSEMSKLLDSARIWNGKEWSYSYLHPYKYLPLREKVSKELDKLASEYGITSGTS